VLLAEVSMSMLRAFVCIGLLFPLGCKREAPSLAVIDAGPVVTPAPIVASSPAPLAFAYVSRTTVINREPSEQGKVDDHGKQVANWLATLARGEFVTPLERTEGAYVRVRMSNDVEGWLKKDTILLDPEVVPATVLEDVEVFDRPESVAVNTKLQIKCGTLVFSLRQSQQFTQVNVPGMNPVWVQTNRLSTDANEVGVARLLSRSRELVASTSGDGADLLQLAKDTYRLARLNSAAEELAPLVNEEAQNEAMNQNCADPADVSADDHERRIAAQCPNCEALRECLKAEAPQGGSEKDCAQKFRESDATECLEWCAP
jgi:hypothetical protein